ncbi:MAG: nucleotidyltransferase family protein [Nanopusillaceae archaeon]|jgi:glucose-1-phosphate thymidylyltransferase
MDELIAIILAGGFARRFRPLSDYIPKPLFPVGGVPVINYNIEKIMELNVSSIIISINKRFENDFRYWLYSLRSFYPEDYISKIHLSIEPSTSEETKLGAIGGLNYTIQEYNINSDILIVLGDNIFNFNLLKVVSLGKRERKTVIASYDIKDIEEARRFGVLNLENNIIKDFEEKPEKPKSTIISTGIYLAPKEKIKLLEEYMKSPNSKDSIGKLFEWMIKEKKETILTYVYNEGFWFDIGTPETYAKAEEYILKQGLYRRWMWP